MTRSPSCCLIANPASGRGRGAQRLPALRAALAAAGITDVRLTTRAGEERDLARAAAGEGIETIIASGGDGTWGNAARGILESGRDARLAISAAGTGNDLAFATKLPAHDPRAVVRMATGLAERRIDVGSVDGVFFLNVCGFGFDPDVLAATQRITWLRGPLVYYLTALRKLFGYRGCNIGLSLEGSEERAVARHLVLVVSNGPRFGGGFLINPSARVDDGQLKICAIRDASPLRRLALFGRALRGTHVRAPEVEMHSARAMRLTFDAPPAFDADGELHQAKGREVEISCLPSRLRLAVPE